MLIQSQSLKILFVLALCTMASCRFGNRTEAPASTSGTGSSTPTQENDYNGKYKSPYRDTEVCVTYQDKSKECKKLDSDRAAVDTPLLFEKINSGTLAIQAKDPSQPKAILYNPEDTQYAFPVKFNFANGEFNYETRTDPKTFWTDTQCKSYAQLAIDGIAYRAERTIDSDFVLTRHFVGQCQTEMKNIARCLAEASECGEETSDANEQMQKDIRTFFGPLLENNLMSADELVELKGFAIHSRYN